MISLPASTLHRIQQLPQLPSVWEGDRRPLNPPEASNGAEKGDCILWVDGNEGLVRALDFVAPDNGPEVVVRALLRAMEVPRPPAPPARPQKIVVRNREIQFFLRGALQNLDIAIDYAPDLPLIDELFRNFETANQHHPDALPAPYQEILPRLARSLWEESPWEVLADHDILAVEIDRPDTPMLYACVMGMLGEEFGVIFYRSLDSLRQFRSAILGNQDGDYLEQVFCSQDCWFLNYEALTGEGEEIDLELLSPEEIRPVFGSIHPLEGIRPFLDEEEAQVLTYALQGLIEFSQRYAEELEEDPIPALSYRSAFSACNPRQKVEVVVRTLPELAAELLNQMEEEEGSALQTEKVVIRDNLIPDNALLSLGMVPWDIRQSLHRHPRLFCQPQIVEAQGDGFPVLIIQTSRPKAEKLIDILRQEGGIQGLCFNPGEDQRHRLSYELGILQTQAGNLYLFGEFSPSSSVHQAARQKWEQRCQDTQGYCGVLVAMGATGASKGKPQLKDMLAFFEQPFLRGHDLSLGVLQLRL